MYKKYSIFMASGSDGRFEDTRATELRITAWVSRRRMVGRTEETLPLDVL
jgi:hypothetical protein